MKARSVFAIQWILMCALTVPGFPQHTASHENKAKASSDWTELEASMEKMHVAMSSLKPSGDSDANFVRLMLPHHEAALDMAKTQLVYGTDPQMRRLAQEIITDQQSEIELMQLWLKQHDSPSQKGTRERDSRR